MKHSPSIGIAIMTHAAKHHLYRCLPPLLFSPLKPRVLVVNSSSGDGTVELAQQMGAETLLVPRKTYNHGLTREQARKVLGTDFLVMATPDAYAEDEHVVGKLIEPLLRKEAAVAYARQLPHEGAGFFESFHREFNYPATGQLRGLGDTQMYGVYTFFCSNSFAAYDNRILDEVGGFPDVLLGEDTVVTAKLLRCGHRIAYVADALVKHSHHYGLLQEFKRNFDTGLARQLYGALLECESGDTQRGRDYAFQLLSTLFAEKPLSLPYGMLLLLTKWCGYRIGRLSAHAPLPFKKALSSQDFYWDQLL